jgi:8-oxo-dGTP pyrophosphatase MutT (NUDIX family)
MKKQRIRPIAIGVFESAGRILVYEGYDTVKEKYFYRPLGGGIEFGETGAQALVREMREETGEEIKDVAFLGMIESIFTCNGDPGHEIVLVYRAAFCSDAVYLREELTAGEDDGTVIRVRWMEKEWFRANPGMLVPEELVEMIG